MKKVFVFDYDGTFYRNHTELLENIKLIEKVRTLGHLFVIATGRSYDSFIKEVNKHHIKFDFLILSSGALIIDSNETVIKTYPMDLNLVIGVDQQLEQFESNLQDKIFIDCFENNKLISKLNQVIKMSYTFEKSEESYKIQSLINEYTKQAFKTYVVRGKSVDYIEIISSKTNKSVAILDLLDFLSADFGVVTAGDSENDTEMLVAFDGYLMMNHDPKLDIHKLRSIDSIKSIIFNELDLEDLK